MPDRARRVVQEPSPPPNTTPGALQHVPPTPAPPGASGARFAVHASASQLAGYRVLPSLLPTRYTHPGTHPIPMPVPTPRGPPRHRVHGGMHI